MARGFMRHPRDFRVSRRTVLFMLPLAAALAACVRTEPAPSSKPDHLVVMVFDQMRPDYIDRFDLPHFKRLRASSRHYPEAYIGHLAAQTIVSHLVIPTGLAPKDLPWQEDVLVDIDGALGKQGAAYKTDDLTREQLWRLLEKTPRDRFITARINDRLGPVFAIGEKNYAARVFGGPYASAIVTLEKASGKCTPDGVNVPPYISDNPRFALECAEPFGTGFSTIYSFDGSRYVPGSDHARPGGDMWTTDAALEIMRRERWAGLFLTFGGIDKVAHMLGEQDDHGLTSVPSQYRLADMLRIADAQLGRILDELATQGLAERTMIVVTADHGGQRYESYLGNGRYQSCCPLENVSAPVEPPYWLQHLNEVGRLKTAYADSSVTVWLSDKSPSNELAVTGGLRDISGVTEVYAKRNSGERYRYDQVYSNLEAQAPAFRRWALRHSGELVNTMAAASGPDLVALMADGFGFGRIGGHGGAQEKVQRIPMIIHVPGEVPSTRTTPLRLMDLAPEITRVLGLADVSR
jgi:hypothetical protein